MCTRVCGVLCVCVCVVWLGWEGVLQPRKHSVLNPPSPPLPSLPFNLPFLRHYCTGGKMFKCPAGTHGNTTGLSTVNCAGFCNPGKSCPVGSTNPNGASDCDAGYYCSPVRGTKCGEPLPCGAVEQYCPVGSGAPVPSTPGYYTTPDDANKESTRESQAQCDAGCVKYKCIQGGGWGCIKCARARVSVNVNVNGLCSAMCSDHRSTCFTVLSQS